MQRILCLNDLVIAYLNSPVPATAPLSARGERKWNFSLSRAPPAPGSAAHSTHSRFLHNFPLEDLRQICFYKTLQPPPGHLCGPPVSVLSAHDDLCVLCPVLVAVSH